MFGDGYLTYSVMKVCIMLNFFSHTYQKQDSTKREWLGSGVVITWICFACIAAVVSTLCLCAPPVFFRTHSYMVITTPSYAWT
jgi:ABC-type multidrug transport system permease subunit